MYNKPSWYDFESCVNFMEELIATSSLIEKNMTLEEKAERDRKHREQKEQWIRKRQIQKNICPDCEGHLIRQKKNKDHIRTWECDNCGISFIRE